MCRPDARRTRKQPSAWLTGRVEWFWCVNVASCRASQLHVRLFIVDYCNCCGSMSGASACLIYGAIDGHRCDKCRNDFPTLESLHRHVDNRLHYVGSGHFPSAVGRRIRVASSKPHLAATTTAMLVSMTMTTTRLLLLSRLPPSLPALASLALAAFSS